jgi:branched-chain amino acid transport system ATP-binding protein
MILDVREIHSYYGTSHILQGVSLQIREGEAVCLLGRNGAGKSTTIKSMIGLVIPKKGEILFAEQNLVGKQPFQIARLGIGYVPEDRRIFPNLTVRENLEVAIQPAKSGRDPWTVDQIFDIFPKLGAMQERRGKQMSGGEQQMLTIARTLMGNPQLLLLDEPSEGLAPLIVSALGDFIAQIIRQGIALLLAEQNSAFALGLAQSAYVIAKGKIEWRGSVQELAADDEMKLRYMSI